MPELIGRIVIQERGVAVVLNTDAQIVGQAFAGQLLWIHDAVENVTIPLSNCPKGTGTCQRRQNVDDIHALGLEAEFSEDYSDTLSVREAVSWTDSRVHGGGIDPQLNGKRPAQAPDATITGGIVWKLLPPLSLEGDLRWVSSQFEDDLNTIKLGSALTIDLRADWQIRDGISIFGKIENLMDAKVATGNTTGVINIAEPRIFEIGVGYAGR
jgi:outer membrane receptor protein involved in Fe transport